MMYRMWMCTCRRNAAEARGMRRCASLYSETTPSVSVDRCGVCGEAWWRAPERAWLPPCHTPVGSGVPACEVDSTLHTRMSNSLRAPNAVLLLFCTGLSTLETRRAGSGTARGTYYVPPPRRARFGRASRFLRGHFRRGWRRGRAGRGAGTPRYRYHTLI